MAAPPEVCLSARRNLIVSAGNERDVFAGGLFILEGDGINPIDLLPTGGLHADERQVCRVASKRQHEGAEVLVYDAEGVRRYLRVDGVDDPHDILVLDDGAMLCVSPFSNAIFEVSPDGESRPVWRAEAPFDAWHVNCITQQAGRLYATAFGRFDAYRAWSGGCEGAGVLFDVESGEDVITGLTQPHTPRWIDGGWAVCSSGAGSLVRVCGGARREIELGGFPRGICALADRIYVGVSAINDPGRTAPGASIAVLDRRTWEEVERLPMPHGNPYDLVAVDEAMTRGLRAGFGFPSRRTRNLDQLAMFDAVGARPTRLWAVGDPLHPQDCRIAIAATLPQVMGAGEAVMVRCRVSNPGRALLVTAPPNPVYLSYKWLDGDGSRVQEAALRTPLPATLPPGALLEVRVVIGAPARAGTYTLVLTAVQDQGLWFDEADHAAALRGSVEVRHGGGGAPAAVAP